MKKKLSYILIQIKQWPMIVRVAVGVCIAAVILAVILAVLIAQQGIGRLPQMEETEKPVTEEEEARQPEIETEIAGLTEIDETVPEFTECQIEAESLLNDLDIYVVDADARLIRDVLFQLKLIPVDSSGTIIPVGARPAAASGNGNLASGNAADGGAEAYASLMNALKLLEECDGKQKSLEEQMESPDFSKEAYEAVLIQKKNALQQYRNAISALPDKIYSDDDKDGAFHINDLPAGTYLLCLYPAEHSSTDLSVSTVKKESEGDRLPDRLYDCGAYGSGVVIRSSVAYTPLRYVEYRVKESAEDAEVNHDYVEREGSIPDTIYFSEDLALHQQSDYTRYEFDPLKLKIAAAVSEEWQEKTLQRALEEDSGQENAAGSPEDEEQEAEDGDLDEEPGEGEDEPGEDTEQDVQGNGAAEAVLAVSKKVTLYANNREEASTAVVAVRAQEMEQLQWKIPDNLKGLVDLEETEGGYRLSLTEPELVAKNLEGKLVLTGNASFGGKLSVKMKLKIIGASRKLSYKQKELFIRNQQGTVVRATVGNYNPQATWYVEKESEQIAFYGWQTDGDSHYFYDEDGQIVTGKQRIGGVNCVFDDTGKLVSASVGIDVSSWQGSIDWEQASWCVTSAIIRCGFRGVDGGLAIDPKYMGNVTQAKKYGITVGLYFHSRAKTPAEAVEEASLAAVMAEKAGKTTLPIYLEMDQEVHGTMSVQDRTAIAKAFCQTVANSGQAAGVSGTPEELEKGMDTKALGNIHVWCVQYNTECTYTGKYDLWQYTNQGRIPGIDGLVDLDQ